MSQLASDAGKRLLALAVLLAAAWLVFKLVLGLVATLVWVVVVVLAIVGIAWAVRTLA